MAEKVSTKVRSYSWSCRGISAKPNHRRRKKNFVTHAAANFEIAERKGVVLRVSAQLPGSFVTLNFSLVENSGCHALFREGITGGRCRGSRRCHSIYLCS